MCIPYHSCFEYIATNTFKCDWSRNFVHFLQPGVDISTHDHDDVHHHLLLVRFAGSIF
ncbi:hypothetical protein JG688_00003795 [Phytophthora aleatoria]|uniref:Uncharacterized protein n=1 Tax=Phytophthora aleatoria TaxID=2496075 RepID=A0A8J5MBT7_9STRA|nr:hypothetical protein JG688_00003795 [Phytophthora aleatoria]